VGNREDILHESDVGIEKIIRKRRFV